jgi:hypothetical protein
MPVLIDSATAITTLADAPTVAAPTAPASSCAPPPDPRSDDAEAPSWATPAAASASQLRARRPRPATPPALAQPFGWRTGTAGAPAYVGGIIGGNLLREFAVRSPTAARTAPLRGHLLPRVPRLRGGPRRSGPGRDPAAVPRPPARQGHHRRVPGRRRRLRLHDHVRPRASRQRPAADPHGPRRLRRRPAGDRRVGPRRSAVACPPGPGSRPGSYHSATGASGDPAAEEDRLSVVPAPDTTDLDRGSRGQPRGRDRRRRPHPVRGQRPPPVQRAAASRCAAPTAADRQQRPHRARLHRRHRRRRSTSRAGRPPAPRVADHCRCACAASASCPASPRPTGASACQRLEQRQMALKAQCDWAARGNGPRLAATTTAPAPPSRPPPWSARPS